jgi:5-methylcytosine-specific restriction endonuclease McrA
MSVLDNPVLKLNKLWVPIGTTSVRQSFSDAGAGAVTLLRFHEGYPTAYRLEDWLNIPVRDDEEYVGVGGPLHSLKKISVPRVCITVNYDRIIAKEQPCTPHNLHKRYGGKDAVTGQPLPKERLSREHVRPRSKGGKSGWENEVPMDKDLNSKRGNRSYRKLGLRKPKILGAPRPLLPINTLLNTHHYPEWRLFNIPEPE